MQCPNSKAEVKVYGDAEFIECQECGCFRYENGEWRPVDMVPTESGDGGKDDNPGSIDDASDDGPSVECPVVDGGAVSEGQRDCEANIPAIAEPTERKPLIEIERFDLGDF